MEFGEDKTGPYICSKHGKMLNLLLERGGHGAVKLKNDSDRHLKYLWDANFNFTTACPSLVFCINPVLKFIATVCVSQSGSRIGLGHQWRRSACFYSANPTKGTLQTSIISGPLPNAFFCE